MDESFINEDSITNEEIALSYEALLESSGEAREQYETYQAELAELEKQRETAKGETTAAYNAWRTLANTYTQDYSMMPDPEIGAKAEETYKAKQEHEKQLEVEASNLRNGAADYLVDHIKESELDALALAAGQNYWDKEKQWQIWEEEKKRLEHEIREKYPDGTDSYADADGKAYMAAKKAQRHAAEQIAKYEQEMRTAAEIAQEILFIYERKELLISARRHFDKEYVVQEAIIECSMGMRKSYLLIPNLHHVYIKGRAFFNVEDTDPDTNLVHFGGCWSTSNKDKDKVLQKLLQEVRNEPDYSLADDPKAEREELNELCVCECSPQISGTWKLGQSNLRIDGAAALLGRCELKCDKGGTIILRRTGQP